MLVVLGMIELGSGLKGTGGGRKTGAGCCGLLWIGDVMEKWCCGAICS